MPRQGDEMRKEIEKTGLVLGGICVFLLVMSMFATPAEAGLLDFLFGPPEVKIDHDAGINLNDIRSIPHHKHTLERKNNIEVEWQLTHDGIINKEYIVTITGMMNKGVKDLEFNLLNLTGDSNTEIEVIRLDNNEKNGRRLSANINRKPIKLKVIYKVQPYEMENGIGWGSAGKSLVSIDNEEYHPWFNSNWKYRNPVNITTDETFSDRLFSVNLTIPNIKVQNCTKEFRVTRLDGGIEVEETLINVTRDLLSGSDRLCSVDINYSMTAGENRTYYIYYGNPNLVSGASSNLETQLNNSIFKLFSQLENGGSTFLSSAGLAWQTFNLSYVVNKTHQDDADWFYNETYGTGATINNPNNAIDNNWSTYADCGGTSGLKGCFWYFNFTKPAGANRLGTQFEIKLGDSSPDHRNITIRQDCWDALPNTVAIRVDMYKSDGDIEPQCWEGSAYVRIVSNGYSPNGNRLYDTKMNWGYFGLEDQQKNLRQIKIGFSNNVAGGNKEINYSIELRNTSTIDNCTSLTGNKITESRETITSVAGGGYYNVSFDLNSVGRISDGLNCVVFTEKDNSANNYIRWNNLDQQFSSLTYPLGRLSLGDTRDLTFELFYQKQPTIVYGSEQSALSIGDQGYVISLINYTQKVGEFGSEPISVLVQYNNSIVSNIDGTLLWNNTEYSTSESSIGSSVVNLTITGTPTIPFLQVNNTDFTFWFNLSVDYVNGSVKTDLSENRTQQGIFSAFLSIQTDKSTYTEGETMTVTGILDKTIPHGPQIMQDMTVNFNNTNYAGGLTFLNSTKERFQRQITIPYMNEETKDYVVNITSTLSGSGSRTATATVNITSSQILINNCTGNATEIVRNFTLTNEETGLPINLTSDGRLDVILRIQSLDSQKNITILGSPGQPNLQICIPPNISYENIQGRIEYNSNSSEYFSRIYYFIYETFNSTPSGQNKNIPLYLIPLSLGKETTFTVRDANTLQPLTDYFVKIFRNVVDENNPIAMLKSSDDGQGSTYLFPPPETVFKYVVYNNLGVIVGTFNNGQPSDTNGDGKYEEIINIGRQVEPDFFRYSENYNVSCTYTNSTREVSCQFKDLSGEFDSMNFLVLRLRGTGRTDICDQTISVVQDTLYSFNCTLPVGDDTYNVIMTGETSEGKVNVLTLTIDFPDTTFGSVGLIITFLIFIALTFIGFSLGSPEGGLIMGMMGIIMCAMIGIITLNLAAIGGLVFIVGIIIVLIKR